MNSKSILLPLFFLANLVLARTPEDAALGPSNVPTPRIKAKTINMLDYIIPPQSINSDKQFYMEGWMECLGIAGSDCVEKGEPRSVRGTFQKQTRSLPDENGNIRFTSSKARTGLIGHPCEYFETRQSYDESGELITKLFLKSEMMDWVYNSAYRSYYDGMNEPLFEWARSNAIEGVAYLQDVGVEIQHECDGSISTFPIPPANYVAHIFSLEGDLSEINKQMGNMGPVVPEWVGMAHEMGEEKAELLVIEGLWGWTKYSPGKEHWRWIYRELYMYLRGVGWVSWRWQEHANNNIWQPFVTHKMGNLDKIIWESPGEVIRNSELCENPGTQPEPTEEPAVSPRHNIRQYRPRFIP